MLCTRTVAHWLGPLFRQPAAPRLSPPILVVCDNVVGGGACTGAVGDVRGPSTVAAPCLQPLLHHLLPPATSLAGSLLGPRFRHAYCAWPVSSTAHSLSPPLATRSTRTLCTPRTSCPRPPCSGPPACPAHRPEAHCALTVSNYHGFGRTARHADQGLQRCGRQSPPPSWRPASFWFLRPCSQHRVRFVER